VPFAAQAPRPGRPQEAAPLDCPAFCVYLRWRPLPPGGLDPEPLVQMGLEGLTECHLPEVAQEPTRQQDATPGDLRLGRTCRDSHLWTLRDYWYGRVGTRIGMDGRHT
jgi:hypothetical protein